MKRGQRRYVNPVRQNVRPLPVPKVAVPEQPEITEEEARKIPTQKGKKNENKETDMP